MQQLRALVAARLRVDEHEHRREVGGRDRLDDERARLARYRHLLARLRLLLLGRFAERRLEVTLARQLHDPGRWHYNAPVRAKRTLFPDTFRVEARFLVVVGRLAPGAR